MDKKVDSAYREVYEFTYNLERDHFGRNHAQAKEFTDRVVKMMRANDAIMKEKA